MISPLARGLRALAAPRFDYIWLGTALFAVGAHLMWRGGAFVAAGDYFPCVFVAPWRCFADAANLWGTSTSAFGAVQFLPGTVAQMWVARMLDLAGIHAALAQTVFHGGLLAFEGVGAAFFARALWQVRAASLAAGAGIVLSLFTAQFILTPQEPFAVGLFGLSAGLALHRAREPVPAWRYATELGALGLGTALLMMTPPLGPAWVLWTACWVVGCALVHDNRRALTGAALGALVALAANGWWLYAGVVALSGGGGSTQASFAAPSDISFVNRNADVVSLLTMRGGWTWGLPEYTPWSVEYDRFPLSAAPFILPCLALAGLLSARRRAAIALGAILVVSLFVAKGTHAPFGQFNAYLYEHAPLFWLLRDPQFEAGPPLYLCLFALAGLGCARVAQWTSSAAMRLRLRTTAAGGAAFATAAFALCASGAALVDGDALPTTWLWGTFPTAITIPDYWRAAGDWLNGHDDGSRVLLLPADDFYAMPYRFGYYGADDISQAFISAPVVRLSAVPLSGYFTAGPSMMVKLARLDASLRARRPALTMLQALGIGWVIERRDVSFHTPDRHIESPASVTTDLAAQPGVAFVRRIGLLEVYRVQAPAPRIRGYADADGATSAAVLSSGGGWRYDARPSADARLIVLGDAYADGWQAFADESSEPLPHVRADGFLNGWRLPASAAHVRLEFAPERAHRILQAIAVVTVMLVMLGLGVAVFSSAPWTRGAGVEPRRP